MTITLSTDAGAAYLDGVYTPTTVSLRPLLGPAATSSDQWGHFIGVDTLYDTPIYLRAYADASRLTFDFSDRPLAWAQRYSRVGYIQFMQVNVAGSPVAPEVLGGALGLQQGYATEADNDYWFVNFMGPGDVLARLPVNEPPFFAYNGMLISPVSSVEQFGSFVAPTGSLWLPNPPTSLPNPMLGPSMLAQINVPLVTSNVIAEMIERLPPLVDVVVSAQALATTPLYQLCIQAIQASTDSEWISDNDRALRLSDITRIRIAGSYLLLNIANSEHLEPVLCAELVPGQSETRLRIYLFDYDHYRGMEELATLGLAQRAVDSIGRRGGTLPQQRQSPRARGGGGLYRPSIELSDGMPLLRINVAAIAFGLNVRRLRHASYPGNLTPISGVQVGLRWRYDGATRILVFDGIENPSWISGSDKQFKTALEQYYQRINEATTHDTTVDVSYFNLIGTPWAAPSPSAVRPTRLADWEEADGVSAD